MKKMLILFIAMMSTVISFGQVQEVKGVETKVVVYDGPKYSAEDYEKERTSTKWFGYSFYNMNSIPVSVEAELYYETSYTKARIIATKTFNLRSQETYIWKKEDGSDFKVNYMSRPYGSGWTMDKKCPENGHGGYYYVKYKAYKLL